MTSTAVSDPSATPTMTPAGRPLALGFAEVVRIDEAESVFWEGSPELERVDSGENMPVGTACGSLAVEGVGMELGVLTEGLDGGSDEAGGIVLSD